jgi:hypothetical protein
MELELECYAVGEAKDLRSYVIDQYVTDCPASVNLDFGQANVTLGELNNFYHESVLILRANRVADAPQRYGFLCFGR